MTYRHGASEVFKGLASTLTLVPSTASTIAMTSRVDLLEWLNNLLQINYTKIEQCGTGAAYCQILDSIYGDLPLNKVNWKAQHEYQYIINFKVLQKAFTDKRIDKPIQIERLVKCRMQDNLEFLQWMKRFWDQNYRESEIGGYDAISRRGGAAMTRGGTPSLPSTSSLSSNPSFPKVRGPSSSAGSVTGSERSGRGALSPFSAVSTGTASTRPSSRVSSRASSHLSQASGLEAKKLKARVEELTHSMESLTKERDFYWKKLKEVEDFIGETIESRAGAGVLEGLDALERIREVLYREENAQ
ncbi:hypothetical protein D9758_011710 [Tetrapyrgos nigripes]|uniref:Uncharacterized protein n=1 Tax=Tetrapyrgos nigripes TaxID=182062 RepID=A0A8H5GDI1_9AGAR|nr:hypothetical protein D9758_011710 [Tetrapyrgos nigripes]